MPPRTPIPPTEGRARAAPAAGEGTDLEGAEIASTREADGGVLRQQNLVIATRWPVLEVEQLRNDLVSPLRYRRLTARPPDPAAVEITLDRPLLHAQLDLGGGQRLHVINVHMKSKIPTGIPGQKIEAYTWRSADAWAEG